jgi:hypothetical protein
MIRASTTHDNHPSDEEKEKEKEKDAGDYEDKVNRQNAQNAHARCVSSWHHRLSMNKEVVDR